VWLSTGADWPERLWSLGDIQKPSGYGPGQLALGGFTWAGELDQMVSRGPLQPQPFCDLKTVPCVEAWKTRHSKTSILHVLLFYSNMASVVDLCSSFRLGTFWFHTPVLREDNEYLSKPCKNSSNLYLLILSSCLGMCSNSDVEGSSSPFPSYSLAGWRSSVRKIEIVSHNTLIQVIIFIFFIFDLLVTS